MAQIPSLANISRMVVVQGLLGDRESCLSSSQLQLYLLGLFRTDAYSAVSESVFLELTNSHAHRLTDELLSVCPLHVRRVLLAHSAGLTAGGIAASLARCTRVEALDLSHCQLPAHNSFFVLFRKMAESSQHLTALRLEEIVTLSNAHVKRALQCLPQLRELSVSCCPQLTDKAFLVDEQLQLSREALAQRGEEQKWRSQLTSVDVSRCRELTSTAMRYITALCGPSLRHINLSYTNADGSALWYLCGYGLISSINKMAAIARTFSYRVISDKDGTEEKLADLLRGTEEIAELLQHQPQPGATLHTDSDSSSHAHSSTEPDSSDSDTDGDHQAEREPVMTTTVQLNLNTHAHESHPSQFHTDTQYEGNSSEQPEKKGEAHTTLLPLGNDDESCSHSDVTFNNELKTVQTDSNGFGLTTHPPSNNDKPLDCFTTSKEDQPCYYDDDAFIQTVSEANVLQESDNSIPFLNIDYVAHAQEESDSSLAEPYEELQAYSLAQEGNTWVYDEMSSLCDELLESAMEGHNDVSMPIGRHITALLNSDTELTDAPGDVIPGAFRLDKAESACQEAVLALCGPGRDLPITEYLDDTVSSQSDEMFEGAVGGRSADLAVPGCLDQSFSSQCEEILEEAVGEPSHDMAAADCHGDSESSQCEEMFEEVIRGLSAGRSITGRHGDESPSSRCEEELEGAVGGSLYEQELAAYFGQLSDPPVAWGYHDDAAAYMQGLSGRSSSSVSDEEIEGGAYFIHPSQLRHSESTFIDEDTIGEEIEIVRDVNTSDFDSIIDAVAQSNQPCSGGAVSRPYLGQFDKPHAEGYVRDPAMAEYGEWASQAQKYHQPYNSLESSDADSQSSGSYETRPYELLLHPDTDLPPADINPECLPDTACEPLLGRPSEECPGVDMESGMSEYFEAAEVAGLPGQSLHAKGRTFELLAQITDIKQGTPVATSIDSEEINEPMNEAMELSHDQNQPEHLPGDHSPDQERLPAQTSPQTLEQAPDQINIPSAQDKTDTQAPIQIHGVSDPRRVSGKERTFAVLRDAAMRCGGQAAGERVYGCGQGQRLYLCGEEDAVTREINERGDAAELMGLRGGDSEEDLEVDAAPFISATSHDPTPATRQASQLGTTEIIASSDNTCAVGSQPVAQLDSHLNSKVNSGDCDIYPGAYELHNSIPVHTADFDTDIVVQNIDHENEPVILKPSSLDEPYQPEGAFITNNRSHEKADNFVDAQNFDTDRKTTEIETTCDKTHTQTLQATTDLTLESNPSPINTRDNETGACPLQTPVEWRSSGDSQESGADNAQSSPSVQTFQADKPNFVCDRSVIVSHAKDLNLDFHCMQDADKTDSSSSSEDEIISSPLVNTEVTFGSNTGQCHEPDTSQMNASASLRHAHAQYNHSDKYEESNSNTADSCHVCESDTPFKRDSLPSNISGAQNVKMDNIGRDLFSEQCDIALDVKSDPSHDNSLDIDSIHVQVDIKDKCNNVLNNDTTKVTSIVSMENSEHSESNENTLKAPQLNMTESSLTNEEVVDSATPGESRDSPDEQDMRPLAYPQIYTPCLTSVDASSIVAHSKPLLAACIRALVLANPRMRTLALSWPLLNDDVLGFVAENCRDLTTINLVECEGLSSIGIANLCQQCPKLTSLGLRGVCFITDLALLPLMDGRELTNLNLAETNVTDLTLHRLAQSCPQLTSLDLSWCEEIMAEGHAAMETLIQSGAGLRKLKLRHLSLNDTCLFSLAAHCVNLEELNVSNAGVADSHLLSLSVRCHRLRVLDVSWNSELTDVGCEAVLRHLVHMENLDMSGIKRLTAKSFVPIIADLPRWRRCQALFKMKQQERHLSGDVTNGDSDDEYDHLYVPARSTVYAPRLRALRLEYSDCVNDAHMAEVVAVCRGTLTVRDYYGDVLQPALFPTR